MIILEIYIGKYNIKNVSKKSIRDYIGVVLQDTFLFTDTIMNNIDITEMSKPERIIEVCKLADIYEDIKRFPETINYMIGKGGNNISGGQKQRIAIARTLIKENSFIIFDDSLSKLDTKTKLDILNNIINLQIGTIIISHDLDVIKRCDKVLFINNKTIEVGKHDDLLRSKIGYIMQKSIIFEGTILENINYANKNVTKEEIIDVCKRLNLHEKIMSLENGYETVISSDTVVFSTGEKQLLNFSRVMVEDPDIIILDEVTASLSYKSEMLFQR